MFHGNAALVLGLVSIFCGQASSCKPNGQECGLNAICRNGGCQCRPHFQSNNPDFRCYQNNVHYAEIVNDPSVVTYFGQSIQLPLPCSFTFTSFESIYEEYQISGGCATKVDAYIAKQDGKFYLKGFRLSSEIYTSSSPFDYQTVDITVTSEVENGVYKYIEHGKGTRIIRQPHYTYDHFLHECGFQIDFTGYDTVLKADAIYTPGLSVSIRQESYEVYLGRYNRYAVAGVTVETEGLSTKEHALFRRVILYGAPRIPYIDVAPECGTARLAKDCAIPDLKKALDNCYWLLNEPLLIRCVDETNNGNQILYILNQCIHSWCFGGQGCINAINFIKDKKCHERDDVINIAKVPAFLRGCNCPSEHKPVDC